MNHTIAIKTGNPIVDEMASLKISGNVIPESWYHTITNENGKVNCLAIHILADIVYWYRPTEHRDETTLSVTYTKNSMMMITCSEIMILRNWRKCFLQIQCIKSFCLIFMFSTRYWLFTVYLKTTRQTYKSV